MGLKQKYYYIQRDVNFSSTEQHFIYKYHFIVSVPWRNSFVYQISLIHMISSIATKFDDNGITIYWWAIEIGKLWGKISLTFAAFNWPNLRYKNGFSQ